MLRGFSYPVLASGALALALTAGLAYGAYYLTTALAAAKSELVTTAAAKTSLENELARAREENLELSSRLAAQVNENLGLTGKLTEVSGTVKTLTKLTKIDKELLQKYSRVYFLNENYVPSSLSEIEPLYQFEPSRHLMVHTKVRRFLEHMLEDAADNDAPLLVLSAYRSFAAQKALKSNYLVTYGTGANRFSAEQGYSEHQLGTTVDFTTTSIGGISLAFESSPGGKWLREHAYEYGFILSYPKGNAYYQYEPWHWRFVGVTLATKLHEDEKNFYDLPQRDIDEYLGEIFD